MTEIDAILRLILAALLGAVIGYDREIKSKPAGMRTHMLVAMGAALFMNLSIMIGTDLEAAKTQVPRIDMARIPAAVVTGVGFLGGGAILRHNLSVTGLTTAAGIWVTAAIGMFAGAGYYLLACIGTGLLAITINFVFRVRDDSLIDR